LAIAQFKLTATKVKPSPTAPRRIPPGQLKTKVATLRQNAQLKLLEPPRHSKQFHELEPEHETVTANQPVMVHRQQQVTLTAKQGQNGFAERSCLFDWRRPRWGATSVHQCQSADIFPVNWLKPMAMLFIVRLNRQRVLQVKSRWENQDQTIVVSGGRVVTEIFLSFCTKFHCAQVHPVGLNCCWLGVELKGGECGCHSLAKS